VRWCTVRSVLHGYAFYAHQRWSPRGHGFNLEDPPGQLTMSMVLDLKSLVLALRLWTASPWPWPRTINPWPWKLSFTLALSIQIFWQPTQPSTHFHSHKCQEVLDFIPEQSCSAAAGSVYSWKAVQQEADFQVLFCSTATLALIERVFSHSGLFTRPHHAR